jgi:hypothetical protein
MARLNIDGGASELAIRFRVVSESRHSQMTRELAEIDRQGGRAVRYLRAEYLMSQGCFSEAREELERLRIGNERNVRLVARLLFACEELQLVVEAAALSALMQKWQR